MDRSERELVAGLRQGSENIFEEVYEHYRPRLYGFLARLTGDRDVAEDLLQETWLRLARHAARLDPDTELGAWLFCVARNLSISYRRWQSVSRAAAELMRRRNPANTPTPFDLSSASQEERRLETALGELAPIHREILLLVCAERFSDRDAARILGISEEAARKRVSRGRALLAEKLREVEPSKEREGKL